MFFTAVLELMSELLVERLATVLVAESFEELMLCDEASLLDSIELLLLALLAPKELIEALLALDEKASCPPFDELELVAKFLQSPVVAARLALEAELSDALVFSDLFDADASLSAPFELEPVW